MTNGLSAFDERYLLSWITGLSFSELATRTVLLSAEQEQQLDGAVKRRIAGEPLQYITGVAPFRFLEVHVEPGVLIPRPETETLVQLVLDWAAGAQAANRPLAIADIGTGSGCIACALASELGDAQILAADIAPVALRVAAENARALGVDWRVSVVESNLCAGLPPEAKGHFDVIVSNPPYVPRDVYDTLPEEVRHFEPELALTSGPDGLHVFRTLVHEAHEWLRPGGLFAVELHETTLQEASAFAQHAGFTDVCITQDLAGKPRFLTALRSMHD